MIAHRANRSGYASLFKGVPHTGARAGGVRPLVLLITLFFVALLLGLLFTPWAQIGDHMESSIERRELYGKALKAVEAELLAPSTASFRGFSGTVISVNKEYNSEICRVHVIVDAHNAFGAMVRGNAVVTFDRIVIDPWRLRSVEWLQGGSVVTRASD